MAESDLIYKDLYYVAVKVFLEKDGKFFVFKDKWGNWDLPGGRIRKHEFETPLADVVERKMKEEVGDVAYTLCKPVVFMRHERVEQLPDGRDNPTIRIFAIGYEAALESGEPRLGDHHIEMEWADIGTFKPEEYFEGGWLKGVEEYLALRRG